MGKRPKHADLVQVARKYVLKTMKCNPVFTEQGTGFDGERPDVIGWRKERSLNGWDVVSVVIECKVSPQDFKADSKKKHRADGLGMGVYRYFLVPEAMKDIQCPDGWGLLVAKPMLYDVSVRKTHESKKHSNNASNEIAFLRSRILEMQRFGR